MQQTWKTIATVIITAIVVGGGVYYWQQNKNSPISNSTETGFIEGSLGYPSEGIPEEMKVCAENVDTKKQYCTATHIDDGKYTYDTGYRLEVPSGNYYVFASLPDWRDYRAYYSEFVTCGLDVGKCKSHTPITVNVLSERTINNVDPQDWYN